MPATASEEVWRNLSYDIAFEASSTGVIRCCAVHNHRDDLFRVLEGLNLHALRCRTQSARELLQSGRALRHVEVQVPDRLGPERLYLTASAKADGGFAGTFCAIDPQSDDLRRADLALLDHVTRSCDREEDYRREAELMLKGLRVLLSPSTAAKRLEDLTALMVEAIAGAAHIVLDVERDGRIRGLIPASRPIRCAVLVSLCQSATAPVSCHKEHDPQTPALRALLGLHSGEVALIHLPMASQNIALICAPRREEGFRGEDIGLAGRFALILRQALMLKEEQDKLVQAARLSVLGQMSASLAHELRQPLNTISVAAQNLELMAAAGPIPPDILSAKIERILGQVDRAAHIMDRIRRFSRRNSEDIARVDIGQLIEGMRVLLGADLTATGIRLKVEIPEPTMLHCDAIQIEQVLTNLVRNAMDALNGIGSAAKTPDGVITIRAMRADGGILLRVEDNGPGFPADVAARPLETFYTSKGAEAGTGLGLSICHMIAREHAGSLTIGNHAGGGFVELRLSERSGV